VNNPLVLQEIINGSAIAVPNHNKRCLRPTASGNVDHLRFCKEDNSTSMLLDANTKIAHVLYGQEELRVVSTDLFENASAYEQARA